MRLINTKTNKPVVTGEVVHHKGQPAFVTGWQIPQHAGSTGRVYVQHMTDERSHREYFPSVYGLEWVEDAQGSQ
jgi:hypothetical protein